MGALALRWQGIFIVLIAIFGIIYALPNLYTDAPAVQLASKSPLTPDFLKTLQTDLSAKKLSPYQIRREANNSLLLYFKESATQLAAQNYLQTHLGEKYTVALNLASTTPHWMHWFAANPMTLGLDLRGGIHFLLAVDTSSLLNRRMQSNLKDMTARLRKAKIRYTALGKDITQGIQIYFPSAAARNAALTLLQNDWPELRFTTPSPAQAEQPYALEARYAEQSVLQIQNDTIEQTITVLRHRINELGIAEPIIQREGKNRIAVDLPGVQDSARAQQILGGTATLAFHLVDTQADSAQALASEHLPIGTMLYRYHKQPLLLHEHVILSGSAITSAVSSVSENGQPAVDIRLNSAQAADFYKITGENIGQPLAIVYIEVTMKPKQAKNGEMLFIPHKVERVISVATIQSALGNNFQITGLEQTEAKNLALLLRAGALPAPISIIEESTVGPSLGKQNIEMGLTSVLIGFLLIVSFMLFYYRLFGLIADIALLLNLILMFALLSLVGMTLTLPGIAGVVLTVGMAIDANVLIFERIREELRRGVSAKAAMKAGYERAFATIVDANVTTLIAAIALVGIGTGSIKGFALVLIIGILVSLFTSVTVTRFLTTVLYNAQTVKKLSIGIK